MPLKSNTISDHLFRKYTKKVAVTIIFFLLCLFSKLICIKLLCHQISTFYKHFKSPTDICSIFYLKLKRIRTRKPIVLIIAISIFLLFLMNYRHQLNVAFIAVHGEKSCFTSSQELNNIRYMVHSFHTVMSKYKLVYWIDSGTLLGAFKYKDVIPWDHDGDISYLLSDLPKLKKFVVPDLVKTFAINIDSYNPVKMVHNRTQVDLFQYTTYAMLKTVANHSNSTLTRAKYRLSPWLESYFDTEIELAIPPSKCLFAGRHVNCPAKPKQLLRHRYPHTLDRKVPYKLQCWLPWNLWKISFNKIDEFV